MVLTNPSSAAGEGDAPTETRLKVNRAALLAQCWAMSWLEQLARKRNCYDGTSTVFKLSAI
jgi:hypothetical protein